MLETALADYLGVHRALGFKLARDELLLKQFVAFFERSGVDRITSELATAWINAPADASAKSSQMVSRVLLNRDKNPQFKCVAAANRTCVAAALGSDARA